MTPLVIRIARPDEYDEIALVWMKSWVTTGLAEANDALLSNLRERVRHEIAQGWSLFVADDNGTLAGMLALHISDHYLDQLFVAPGYQGRSVGRHLLAFTREQMPDEVWLNVRAETKRPGAGMNVKVSCMKRRRSTR